METAFSNLLFGRSYKRDNITFYSLANHISYKEIHSSYLELVYACGFARVDSMVAIYPTSFSLPLTLYAAFHDYLLTSYIR